MIKTLGQENERVLAEKDAAVTEKKYIFFRLSVAN
jgi:hypothetical protein